MTSLATGLTRSFNAPSVTASIAEATEGVPVIRMTGTSKSCARTPRSSSTPVIPGISMSLRIALNERRFAQLRGRCGLDLSDGLFWLLPSHRPIAQESPSNMPDEKPRTTTSPRRPWSSALRSSSLPARPLR
jgi:hypothetical protein